MSCREILASKVSMNATNYEICSIWILLNTNFAANDLVIMYDKSKFGAYIHKFRKQLQDQHVTLTRSTLNLINL